MGFFDRVWLLSGRREDGASGDSANIDPRLMQTLTPELRRTRVVLSPANGLKPFVNRPTGTNFSYLLHAAAVHPVAARLPSPAHRSAMISLLLPTISASGITHPGPATLLTTGSSPYRQHSKSMTQIHDVIAAATIRSAAAAVIENSAPATKLGSPLLHTG